MRTPFLFGLSLALWPAVVSAQVIITEVEPNPTDSSDNGEWVEIQNIGTSSASLAGWSITDYVGSNPQTDLGRENTTRWVFPATASIAAGRTIVVARQAVGNAFLEEHGRRPTWEMQVAMAATDDAMTPNLMPTGGNDTIQLVNGNTGDAVVLRNAMGAVVSGVEWGTLDRTVPGTPLAMVPGAGQSLSRIAMTGSSHRDFQILMRPTPFVGFIGPGAPSIGNVVARPLHVSFGDTFTVTASVTDADGVREVEIYLATATATTGPSMTSYVSTTMTATRSNGFRFAAPVENLGSGLGFGEPASFHERYVRWFITASDTVSSTATDPLMAEEDRSNTRYRQRNVMPRMPVTIASAREQGASEIPRWLDHSVRVRGVVVVPPYTFSDRGDFALTDASGRGIFVFDPNGDVDRLAEGATVEVVGRINQFRGLTQIEGPGLEVKDLGMMMQVPVMQLTIAQVLAMAENLESTLVEIKDVDFVRTATSWPGRGSGGQVQIRDASGMMIDVRVNSGTNLFGQPTPRYGFHIRGVVGQFTTSNPPRGGYQIVPRGMADITAKPMPPPADSGVSPGADGGVRADTGVRTDGGSSSKDGGTGGNDVAEDSGCGCSTSKSDAPSSLAGIAALLALALVMRRRRS